jgi:ubiquinone biosynthesis protein
MPDELAQLLLEHMKHLDTLDADALRADLRGFVDTYLHAVLAELEIAEAIGQFFAIVRRHRLVMDGRLTVLFVSFITAQGLGQRLDPALNVFEVIKPWVGREALQLRRHTWNQFSS